MIKVNDMIKDFKYMALKRKTAYNNVYPKNCGYIWPSGWLSFDCIGLIKSYINNPKIAYKTKPAGYYVKPGKVIPDATGYGILQLCTKKSNNFKKIPKGSYLLYEDYDHGAIYAGAEFKDDGGVVNVIECCDDPVGYGVTTSYIDENGYRWDHKNGTCMGKWLYHGLLSKYVDYSEPKKKTVTSIAKEVIDGKWGNYPERKNALEKAGYNYEAVQKKVNELLKK